MGKKKRKYYIIKCKETIVLSAVPIAIMLVKLIAIFYRWAAVLHKYQFTLQACCPKSIYPPHPCLRRSQNMYGAIGMINRAY